MKAQLNKSEHSIFTTGSTYYNKYIINNETKCNLQEIGQVRKTLQGGSAK